MKPTTFLPRIFFLLFVAVLFASCNDKKITELNTKVTQLESTLNNLNSYVLSLSVTQSGYLSESNSKDRNYWDIKLPTEANNVFLAYHRKNASEMWQPIAGVYTGNGYARIPYSYSYLNEEYIVVGFRYLVSNSSSN